MTAAGSEGSKFLLALAPMPALLWSASAGVEGVDVQMSAGVAGSGSAINERQKGYDPLTGPGIRQELKK